MSNSERWLKLFNWLSMVKSLKFVTVANSAERYRISTGVLRHVSKNLFTADFFLSATRCSTLKLRRDSGSLKLFVAKNAEATCVRRCEGKDAGNLHVMAGRRSSSQRIFWSAAQEV